MQEKDLIKFIEGKSNPTEKQTVIQWIRKDIEHQKRFNIIKATHVAEKLDSSKEINIENAYKYFTTQKNKRKRTRRIALVASLVLPFLLWYTYTSLPYTNFTGAQNTLSSNIKVISTEYGDHEMITLPDGSTVTLNSNSSIKYHGDFDQTIRKVTLTGEAFFDIKRDETRPFIVHTEHLKVKVLGTSFNVKSYPKDEKIETTLVSGKVEVIQDKKKNAIVLQPSHRATFDKSKSDIKVDKVDSKSIVAWQEGKLIFDNTPLKQVILDLNRKYNVEFVVQSDALLQYKYTGEFDNLELEDVLELLKISSPINYKYINNKIMLNSE